MKTRILAVLAFILISSPASWAQAPAPGSFDSGGVTIQYLDKGRGAPVVLLHGFTGSYARHWEAPGVIAALEGAGYRVIAMDCRGHGQSGKPHDATQYGLEMVQDVVRLLDHLHIDRTHLVGYSMGGEIALQFAVRYPARLKTVAVLGAGWVGEDTGPIRTLMNDMADGFAKKDATALVRGVTSNGQDGSSLSAAEITAASQALFARNDADALAACARAMTTLFEIPKDRLLAVTLPMLAMVGDHDVANADGVKQLKTVVRGLEVVELAGANHATSVRPSAAPLVAFLNAHRD